MAHGAHRFEPVVPLRGGLDGLLLGPGLKDAGQGTPCDFVSEPAGMSQVVEHNLGPALDRGSNHFVQEGRAI